MLLNKGKNGMSVASRKSYVSLKQEGGVGRCNMKIALHGSRALLSRNGGMVGVALRGTPLSRQVG